jgi:FtsZ-binding cell division protein ZapB
MATPPPLQVQPQSSPLLQRKLRNETNIWIVIDELKEKVDNLEQENKELKEKIKELALENKELRNEHKRMFVYLQPLIGHRLIEALKNEV